ncbi:MAG TPA: hypothetical protein VGG70_12655 [Candidatus Cybelea sp.]|jgi:hypothetical protein
MSRQSWSWIVFVALAVAVCAFSRARAEETATPSVEAFYSAAVDSMRALRQPQYLAYSIEGQGRGLDVDLRVLNHLVWLEFTMSSPPEESDPITWSLHHRTDDYASEIVDEEGRRLVSTRAFFDPTWYGAFRALRDGMLDYQRDDPPVSAYATPTPGPASDLRTIAVVKVIGTNIYRVIDSGPSPCLNGDPGHALHLVSRDGNPTHQLADVVVDLRNMHFCTIRFNVSNLTEHGWRGSVEQHYADVGGHWLQTDGTIETSSRTLGILVYHGIWRYRLVNVTFPATIPPERFLRPLDQ